MDNHDIDRAAGRLATFILGVAISAYLLIMTTTAKLFILPGTTEEGLNPGPVIWYLGLMAFGCILLHDRKAGLRNDLIACFLLGLGSMLGMMLAMWAEEITHQGNLSVFITMTGLVAALWVTISILRSFITHEVIEHQDQ